jgi:hypothetical protein
VIVASTAYVVGVGIIPVVSRLCSGEDACVAVDDPSSEVKMDPVVEVVTVSEPVVDPVVDLVVPIPETTVDLVVRLTRLILMEFCPLPGAKARPNLSRMNTSPLLGVMGVGVCAKVDVVNDEALDEDESETSAGEETTVDGEMEMLFSSAWRRAIVTRSLRKTLGLTPLRSRWTQ